MPYNVTEFEIVRDFLYEIEGYTPLEYDFNDPCMEDFTEEFPEC